MNENTTWARPFGPTIICQKPYIPRPDSVLAWCLSLFFKLSIAFLAATGFCGQTDDANYLSNSLSIAVDDYAKKVCEDRQFTGVILIAQDGNPLIRKAYGFADWKIRIPNTPDTRFMIFSITKQFTAAAILRLADQGKLSIHDPVAKYVSYWPREWNAVTIHHLLTHTSGIEVMHLVRWMETYYPQHWSLPEQESFKPGPLIDVPGSTLSYSNTGYTVLSIIISHISQKSFSETLEKEVFVPLGMTNTELEGERRVPGRARGHHFSNGVARYSEQKTRAITGAGDVVTTIEDLLKWDEALYRNDFLSSGALKSMFSPHIRGKMGGKLGDFGYAWQQIKLNNQTLYRWSGGGAGFVCFVIRWPELHLFIAVLTNRRDDGLSFKSLSFAGTVEALIRQSKQATF